MSYINIHLQVRMTGEISEFVDNFQISYLSVTTITNPIVKVTNSAKENNNSEGL